MVNKLSEIKEDVKVIYYLHGEEVICEVKDLPNDLSNIKTIWIAVGEGCPTFNPLSIMLYNMMLNFQYNEEWIHKMKELLDEELWLKAINNFNKASKSLERLFPSSLIIYGECKDEKNNDHLFKIYNMTERERTQKLWKDGYL